VADSRRDRSRGPIARLLPWLSRGPHVFALVGRSGTGKSYKARAIAQRHNIELIIDDGLIIRNGTIVAGRSAKREKGIISAVRTAVFANPDQLEDARRVLAAERVRRILVIGTSVKMVRRIVGSLGLPAPSRVIPIEQAASREEIARALRVRAEQGKHIIPVPSVEIKRSYPHIFFESMKELITGTRRGLRRRPQDSNLVEKTVVRPPYSRPRRAKPAGAAAQAAGPELPSPSAGPPERHPER
jgi:ABC-type oligopeptide transport system ATPase subunit